MRLSIESCSPDEEVLVDDVNYGIADCRKRLRSQRSSLRAQNHPPKDGSSGQVRPATGRVGSYAEVLANSMSQNSLSRLVECLLEPPRNAPAQEEKMEQEEAVIT
jgi:hypothetical protein